MRINVRPHSRNRKSAPVNTGIGTRNIREIFRGVDSFVELVSDMAEKGQQNVENTGKIKTPSGKSAMYGFSVKMGGAGLPQVEQFGNIMKKTEEEPVMEDSREPFVDIFEETDSIEVIVELPGIEEKYLSYKIKDDVLTLKASSKDRKYTKEVSLPCKVSLLKSAYKNGVLRLILEKKKNEQ
jgi:HSP20 family protein